MRTSVSPGDAGPLEWDALEHVGTVDKVEGDRIKLTKSDSGDRQHHFLEKRLVSGVEGNKVPASLRNLPQRLRLSLSWRRKPWTV